MPVMGWPPDTSRMVTFLPLSVGMNCGPVCFDDTVVVGLASFAMLFAQARLILFDDFS